ncbi:hypothetical protein C8J57DRAFT_1237168 [Mycena rebaudengoi]|nr:hypothetical protein C8J57DRAFT_1237168 [Mycena rebaudengoi]
MKLIFSLATLLLISATNALYIPGVAQRNHNVRRDPCAEFDAAKQKTLAVYKILSGITAVDDNDPSFLSWAATNYEPYMMAHTQCQAAQIAGLSRYQPFCLIDPARPAGFSTRLVYATIAALHR